MQGTGSALLTAPALYASAPHPARPSAESALPARGREGVRRGPSDRLQSPHRLAVARKQAVAVAMAAGADDMRAAADDVGDGGVVGGEDPRIEDDVAAGRRERGMLAVEHDDVGRVPRRDRAD